ncbi:MAG: recombination mediator RecR [Aestuariivita sp.]|nr:recombination mediator RecR [Aestuariivita sp.]MCY4202251.1 recombination mediator RecR [Aestuariivita sp.]MCY4287419.1 recombination mediator RecR [Aestuariivita sp.]MCY4347253.1 recombination mediator RecR [Aestuariivita sp.]
MSSPSDIDALIDLMSKLPGLGPRSARRAVLHMVVRRDRILQPLADLMHRVSVGSYKCSICGNISMSPICKICQDEERTTGSLCVVENISDLWAMERAGVFDGHYHVLGGVLSALDSVGPDQLRVPQLVERVESQDFEEVILALNATVDGQTTAHYIADQLMGKCRVSLLAHGVPIGGELDYLDDGTISAAMYARKTLE